MRLLLDTHIAVWSAAETRKIPAKVQKLIVAPTNEVFVSVASIWEIGIKTRDGQTKDMPFSAATAAAAFERLGFTLLNILPLHAIRVGDYAVAHADPFDRMILAQSQLENLLLVTADAKLAAYSDTVITW